MTVNIVLDYEAAIDVLNFITISFWFILAFVLIEYSNSIKNWSWLKVLIVIFLFVYTSVTISSVNEQFVNALDMEYTKRACSENSVVKLIACKKLDLLETCEAKPGIFFGNY